MHQPRLLALGIAHHFQHHGRHGAWCRSRPAPRGRRACSAPCTSASSIEDHRPSAPAASSARLPRGCRRTFGASSLQRRNPHALALLQPVLAIGALAVDAQLAFADDALDVGERQAGKARLEKAIDPHVVLVGGDDHGLHLGRQRRRLRSDLFGLRRRRGAPRAAAAPASRTIAAADGRDARFAADRSRDARRARSTRSRGGRAEAGRSLALLGSGRLLLAAPAAGRWPLAERLLAAPGLAGRAVLAGRSLPGPRLARGFLVRRLMGRSGGWLCLAQKPLRVTVELALAERAGGQAKPCSRRAGARVVRQIRPSKQ